MKIAIVWYWDRASEIFDNWRDGHRAAIEEIGKEHDIHWFLDKKIPDPGHGWDFVLFWDDSNSTFFEEVHRYDCRKGMILTTDPQNFDNLRKIDVVYVESGPVYDAVRSQGIRTIRAMGTDTDFFVPGNVEKDIEYFYPATFSPWKRQQDVAHLGDKLLCVGTIQPDGQEIYEYCLSQGVKCEIGYFPVEKILGYYQRAKKVPIPAVHGSERTVLEAMSCNILPDVTSEHNPRTQSYVKEYLASGEKTPRDFVLKNYSHKVFAQNLLKGILHA